ncbi:inositol oxygenase [Acidobacteria bacterium AH-259-O06]|nr:inositol oxygenase [Acidobacteria bacterium AH-259-O06]
MNIEGENPLKNLEEWDDFVEERYRPDRKTEDFRDYDKAPQSVKEFYRLNHERQTVEFVKKRRQTYLPHTREKTGMWEVLLRLNELVDDSDPDTSLPQLVHALQTAERIRSDDHPDWMVLVGLIHDAGKMLWFWGEPQWAVVGDTFVVGCAWSDKIIYPKYFKKNPDSQVPKYQSRLGIYEEGCGLDNVLLSWGHDEYIYRVVKDSKLPTEALYMLRYHSFYPWHREGGYRQFMNGQDREMLPWVQEFNKYDLYSKSDDIPDVQSLQPYYKGLFGKYLPSELNW